jgi:hypothetical protein
MPISNKDLGKYKRPGIFIEEIDLSIISRPVQEVLINLVPGFSKKGPFNKPVLVNDPQTFEDIFGPVDKNLENKGSYFHRTVEDMLTVGPIWALNLLATDPNRDTLQWESISVAAQYDNGPVNTAGYEYFFNRQDFWERDVESFMDIVDEAYATNPNQPNPAHDLFSITNMGDKTVTVWTFKSSITGFDVSAESWYGGADKVPLFMNPKDYISDYMISVLSVVGDYTDYATLSKDPYWGQYFNTNGLLKAQVQNFVSDRLTTVNAYYDVCLIPNFRDTSGLDMYIKNVINSNTDKTGLFCYYNEDVLLNADFYKGNIDTIGQTLVVTEDPLNDIYEKKNINFMSYKTNIGENITYTEQLLDDVGNPFGNYGADLSVAYYGDRTGINTNWYTNIAPTTGSTYSYVISSASATNIVLTDVTGIEANDVVYFSNSFGPVDSATPYYVLTATVATSGITVSTTKGGPTLGGFTSPTRPTFVYSLKQKYYDGIGDGLGNFFTYNIGEQYILTNNGSYSPLFFEPLVISNSAQTTGYSRYDVVYLSTDNTTIHTVKGNQVIGTTPSKPNFLLSNANTIILGYVKLQYTLVASVTPTLTMTWYPTTVNYYNVSGSYKVLAPTTEVTAVSGVTTGGVKYLDLYFVGTSGSTDYTNYDKLRRNKIFTEIYTAALTGKSVIINRVDGTKYSINATVYEPTATKDGHMIIFFDTLGSTNPFEYYNVSTGGFLIYYIDYELVLVPSTTNLEYLITTKKEVSDLPNNYGIVAKYSTLYLDYYNGNLNDGDYIFFNNDSGQTTRIYLKMWLDIDKNLTIGFSSGPETQPDTILSQVDINYNSELIVYSDTGSYKQTLEIDNTSYITDFTNVTYVYVDKTRYSEVTKGWYLDAYYDTSYYDAPGEGYILGAVPRKLVRITSTVIDTVDPTKKILYADGPIRILSNISGSTTDYYTTARMSIDNYVTEYNGLAMKPFVVSPESIPNGTDARLDTIMSVMGKNTNLAKGLANKNRITWRYLIDSFGLGLTHNSKQEFVDVCGMKLNCLGFINMPSARQFKTSINPSFTNDDRTLNTEYIKEGGNPDKNPIFTYSFGDGKGMSCVGYFFPYIKDVNDSSKFIPPAAKVAKAYMAKFTGGLGNAYPWQIIAGPQFSLMGEVAATEIRFTNEDLENMYAMGANPIVYSLNRGYNINSENSAQVYPLSSLSYIHSREVLIELENRLYDMLLNYHWRFNTPEIRAEIKFRADQICKEMLDSNALYDFKNVCDKTNNTDYIIDLQMGVLDTYIEIIKGMGIIVNNITILKKGTIASGGFLPA